MVALQLDQNLGGRHGRRVYYEDVLLNRQELRGFPGWRDLPQEIAEVRFRAGRVLIKAKTPLSVDHVVVQTGGTLQLPLFGTLVVGNQAFEFEVNDV